MADFKTRIEDIIGEIQSLGDDTSSDTNQAITDALTDATANIIDVVNPDLLWMMGTESTPVTSNPLASSPIVTSKIIKVERQNGDDVHGAYVSCTNVAPFLLSQIQDPNSIYYPSKESPLWVWDNETIYVFPTPSESNGARYVYIAYPAVTHDDTSVDSPFPSELDQVVVLGACVKLKQRQIAFFIDDEDPENVQANKIQLDDLLARYKDALAPYVAQVPVE